MGKAVDKADNQYIWREYNRSKESELTYEI